MKISDTKRAKGVSMKYSAVYYRERYDTGKKRGQRDQRGEKNSMYGRTRTDSKQNAIKGAHKISEWQTNNKKPCPVCGKEYNPGNLAQHTRGKKCSTE